MVTYYKEISITWVAKPTRPTVWDGIYSIHVNASQLGVFNIRVCAMANTTSGGGAVSCSAYIDYGSNSELYPATFRGPTVYTWNAGIPYAFFEEIPGVTHQVNYTETNKVSVPVNIYQITSDRNQR